MKIIDNFIPNNEYTKRIFVRQGNKVYSKNVEDKRYGLFRKFKNATKARRFFEPFILNGSFTQMGKFYLSSR